MVKKFAIVKYTEENDALGIIPLKWTSFEEDICHFPPIRSSETQEKLVRREEEPGDNWILCPIQILHKYETYSEARLNLKKAEETSNLDTDEELDTRRRKKRCFLLPGENDDDDDDDTSFLKKQRKNGHKTIEYPSLIPFNTANPNCDSENSSISNISTASTSRCSTPSAPIQQIPKIFPSSRKTTDSDRVLLAQLQLTVAAMAEQINKMNSKIDVLLANNQQMNTDGQQNIEEQYLSHLPLENLEDFNKLEEKTNTDDNFTKQFIRILASTGGKDVRSLVSNMIKRVMSDSLAEQFSYSGKIINEKQKLSFGNKKICRCIHAAARKIFADASDEKIRGALCSWLQQAKTRKNRK